MSEIACLTVSVIGNATPLKVCCLVSILISVFTSVFFISSSSSSLRDNGAGAATVFLCLR